MREDVVFPLAVLIFIIVVGNFSFYTACDPEPCNPLSPDCFNESCDNNRGMTTSIFTTIFSVGTMIFLLWLWIDGVSIKKRTIGNILEGLTIPYLSMFVVCLMFSFLVIAIIGFIRWM